MCFPWRFPRATLISIGILCSDVRGYAPSETLPSGTTGRRLFKYDLATLGVVSEFPKSPIEMLDDHADTVRDVTCHPSQSELVMTAR